MKFTLTKPCKDCPFRNDITPYLTEARAKEITDGILKDDITFTCHKTLDGTWEHDEDGKYTPGDGDIHCAGALILNEKEGRPNWRIRLAAFLGLFEPERLDLSAPVYDSAKDMCRAHFAASKR